MRSMARMAGFWAACGGIVLSWQVAGAQSPGSPSLDAPSLDAPFSDTLPRDEPRIAQLIDQLGSASYRERTAAGESLAALGSMTRSQLETAIEHDDAEIRLQAKQLLAKLKVEELWSAAPVTLSAEPASVGQTLHVIAAQSGNNVLMGDQYGRFHDQEISLEAVQGTFWPLLDDVCRQSGNRLRPHYDSRQPGVVVIEGVAGKFPTAYAGPLRSQISSARRAYSEDVDFESHSSEVTHSFQLNLQTMWEDRFKLVAYRTQPEVLAATTDTGEALSATQPNSGSWNVNTGGPRQLTTNLRLNPPPTAAKELDTLRLGWDLVAVGDFAVLEIDDLHASQPHFQDDVELEIENVTVTSGSRCEVTLRLRRDMMLPEPQEVVFQENDVELFDAEGHPFRKQGQSNHLGDSVATLKIGFQGEKSDSVPTKLRFHYPRIRSQRNLELVFRHVPLPTGRPE